MNYSRRLWGSLKDPPPTHILVPALA